MTALYSPLFPLGAVSVGLTVLCVPCCGFRNATRKERRALDMSEVDLVIGSFEEVGLSDVLHAMSR